MAIVHDNSALQCAHKASSPALGARGFCLEVTDCLEGAGRASEFWVGDVLTVDPEVVPTAGSLVITVTGEDRIAIRSQQVNGAGQIWLQLEGELQVSGLDQPKGWTSTLTGRWVPE